MIPEKICGVHFPFLITINDTSWTITSRSALLVKSVRVLKRPFFASINQFTLRARELPKRTRRNISAVMHLDHCQKHHILMPSVTVGLDVCRAPAVKRDLNYSQGAHVHVGEGAWLGGVVSQFIQQR
jgi:hypothetical protein